MAFPSTTRHKLWMNRRGGAATAFQEVESTGAPLGTPDTVHHVGYLESGTYNREVTDETQADVSGATHDVGSTTEAILTIKPMSRDVLHLEAPKVFSGYARVFQELSGAKQGTASAMGQIAVICAAKFRKTFGWDLSDMFPQWEMVCSANTSGATLTVDTSAFTGILGAGVGNATILAGEYEDIVEFTYA